MVTGPIAAGAQAPGPPPVDGFVESDGFAFAEASWFGFGGGDAPDAADDDLGFDEGQAPDEGQEAEDGQEPQIVTNVELSGCDAAPQLSVGISVTAENPLEYLWVGGTVGEKWIEPSVTFDSGDKTFEYNEVFDLAEMKNDQGAWNNVWLSVDVGDVAGGFNSDWIDVFADFDDCVLYDWDDWDNWDDWDDWDDWDGWIGTDGPEVVADSFTLTECAASPKLSVNYTARDENGIEDAWMYISDQYYEEVASVEYAPGIDFDADATEFTVNQIIDVKNLRDKGRDYLEISFSSVGNVESWLSENYSSIELDFEACTVEIVDPRPLLIGGDGLTPELEVTSVTVSQCDVMPIVSIGFTVTDSDGIDSITSDAYFETEDDSDLQQPEVDFEIGVTEVSATADFEARIAQKFRAFVDARDSANAWDAVRLEITVDPTDCTVEYVDMDSPDYWDGYDEELGGWSVPSIKIDSLTIDKCDTEPVLSVGYTLADEKGIAEASLFLPNAESGNVIEPGSIATEVTGVYAFDRYSSDRSDGVNLLYIEASNSDGHSNGYEAEISVDLDSCQVETTKVWYWD